MSDTITTAEDAVRKARRLLEADTERRVESVRALTQAALDSDDADRAAIDARTAHEKAWTAALATGWNERDLRATGVRAPGNRARTARRRTTRNTSTDTAGHTGGENE